MGVAEGDGKLIPFWKRLDYSKAILKIGIGKKSGFDGGEFILSV